MSRFSLKCVTATVFPLAGYVVMPNHIHLLIGEPTQGTPSLVLQVLKQRVSRQLRRKPRKKLSSQQLALPFPHASGLLPQFWQPRFYDFKTGPGVVFLFTRTRQLD